MSVWGRRWWVRTPAGSRKGSALGPSPAPLGLCSQLGRNCLRQALTRGASDIFRAWGGGGGGVALGGRGRPRYSRTPAGAARTPAPLLRSALGRTRPAPSSASGGEQAEETPGTAKAKARGSERLPSPAGKLRPGVEGGMGLGPKARGQDQGEGCSGGGTGPLGASGSLLETRGPRLRLSQA